MYITEKIDRFFHPPESSYFLFGPRGTGKSLWLESYYPNAFRVDLLKPEVLRQYLARPESLREEISTFKGHVIVLDEIQRCPQLLDVVHELIESDTMYQFVLTGSSARKLKRMGSNLLGGRALECSLHPFLPAELGDLFNLEAALQTGLLPLVLADPSQEARLKAYHGLYLKEEVQQEGLVRNVGQFARFLEALSFSHASILEISGIATDAHTARKTVESYVEVVEDLLLGFRLPVFTKRAKRKTIMRSKFYLFDAGVYQTMRPKGPLDQGGDILGAALEGLIIQSVRAYLKYRQDDSQIYFWQTKTGVEVDLIVYGSAGFFAFEIKNSQTLRPKDLSGLKTFCQDYPEAKPICLYRGSQVSIRDGIQLIPIESFLRSLAPRYSITEVVNTSKS